MPLLVVQHGVVGADSTTEDRKNFRAVAVTKGQLAWVLMKQEKYEGAIALYQEARTLFEQQNEPQAVANAWQGIGRIHEEASQYEEAETAYRRSLEIHTQTNNLAGQGKILNELGSLYGHNLNRLKEAITFYRQAADIYVALGDLRFEGLVRNNIATILNTLNRDDEALSEILQAIECNKPYGHAAEPWKNFAILRDIEPLPATQQQPRQHGNKHGMPTWPIGSRGAMHRHMTANWWIQFWDC